MSEIQEQLSQRKQHSFTADRLDGTKSYDLTKDHKPGEENERRRITQSGGQLYQNGLPLGSPPPVGGHQHPFHIGPVRVHPGRLSVRIII